MTVDGGAWSRTSLGSLEAYRITEIPRRRDDIEPKQRVAALMAAYHAGIAGQQAGTVAFGWVRTAVTRPRHRPSCEPRSVIG